MEELLLDIPWDQTKERNPVSVFQELVCSWERGRPTLRPLYKVPLEPGLEQKQAQGQWQKQLRAGHSVACGEGKVGLRDSVSHTHKPMQPEEARPPSRQKYHKIPSFHNKDKNTHSY